MFKIARKWGIVISVVLLGTLVGVAWAMHENNSKDGVAVVELFTSEGCSSCPPADALLAKLLKEGQERVYLLAFHVDYWDTPQWMDAFSDAKFSRRQEEYAKVSGSQDVYTPQMIVNGKKRFVGSDEQVARKEIAAAMKKSPLAMLELNAKVSDGQVAVNCTMSPSGVGKYLNVALVQRGIERKIGGGENSGRVLPHENVVQAFESVKTTGNSMDVKLPIPVGVAVEKFSVIAYLQDESMQVVGARGVDLKVAEK